MPMPPEGSTAFPREGRHDRCGQGLFRTVADLVFGFGSRPNKKDDDRTDKNGKWGFAVTF